MSITISAEMFFNEPLTQTPEMTLDSQNRKFTESKPTKRKIDLKEENHHSGASVQLEGDFYSIINLNHDLINHPVAAMFMNEIYPCEKISSFSYFGESFVHGFQTFFDDGANNLDKNEVYNIDALLKYFKYNCKGLLPMTIEDIEKIVEFYYSGYFTGKEYLSNQSMIKLRHDLQSARYDFSNTVNTMLPITQDNNVNYGVTYLNIPEMKFLDKDKIHLQVKNAMAKTTKVIQSAFDNQYSQN
jgi:hypothetical protein